MSSTAGLQIDALLVSQRGVQILLQAMPPTTSSDQAAAARATPSGWQQLQQRDTGLVLFNGGDGTASAGVASSDDPTAAVPETPAAYLLFRSPAVEDGGTYSPITVLYSIEGRRLNATRPDLLYYQVGQLYVAFECLMHP